MKQLETQVRAWTKPANDTLVGGTAADLVKSKEQLIMENALLRQQVIVLKRQVTRPQLTAKDRSLLVVLASRVKDWQNALLLVKPGLAQGRFQALLATEIKGQGAQATDF